ncbi:EpsG family protein [Sphingomonas aliaeris]|uniref:EpsG family protein n=1 Tax=Sphingomonas aliaeris TaxID=2759526 RepID=A0A974NX25_9SPHN|nr:EpsG family protein [Sphingomonas aliaeris]QQV78471.1 EpsG family protein [Sphingomonas aliaeris]
MLPYWLLFALWAVGAVQAERRSNQTLQPIFFIAACVLTTLMIGLRLEVGGDWGAYQRMYEDIYFLALPEALGTTDPGYAMVNWLGVQFGLGIGFVNTVCATIFMVGVGRLAWKQPNPSLAMLIAVPYLVIVVAMGYTRQAAAIGLICLAVADASETKILRLVFLSAFAALFHKTAILILPLLLVPVLRRNIVYGAIGALAFIAVFVILLRDASDELITNYVNSTYDSQRGGDKSGHDHCPRHTLPDFAREIRSPRFPKEFLDRIGVCVSPSGRRVGSIGCIFGR